MPKQSHHGPLDEENLAKLLQERLMREQPSEDFRDALYGKLLRQRMHRAAHASTTRQRSWGMLRWMSSVMIACVVLLVGTGFTTTYAYVSPSITRQSSLYSLKMIVESAELSLHSSPEDRAGSLLKFAKRRIDELNVLMGRGSLDPETLAAIVRYTEEALAQASGAIDASTQNIIRELVAKEAASQRSLLEEVLSRYGYDAATIDPSIVKNDNQTGDALSVFEETISKVGTVEVQALEQNLNRDSVQSSREPNDLSLSFTSSPERILRPEDTLALRMTLHSSGWSPIDDATLRVEWGDATEESLSLTGLTQIPDSTHEFHHQYQRAGTYVIRIRVSSEYDEWTTANNRLTHTITVTEEKPLCAPGERRCNDEHTVVRCSTSKGIASWQRDRICIDGTECRDGQCVPPDCTSTCTTVGSRQCSADGKSFEVCRRVGSCLQWQVGAGCDTGCSAGICTAKPSLCGNGILDATEQCDDGNTASGDGCSPQCTKEQSCIDSDGGSNIAVYGTVTDTQGVEKDFCENSTTLLEFTCSASQRAFAERIGCRFGCQNGACLRGALCGNGKLENTEQCDDGNTMNGDGCSSTCTTESKETSCIDTDGGDVPVKQGTTSFQSTNLTDFCAADGKLWEYKCFGPSAITSTIYTCATPCVNGACTPTSNICGNDIVESPETCDDGNVTSYDGCSSICKKELSCTDTDGGSVAGVRGSVTQGALTDSDACTSNIHLKEHFCATPYQPSSTSITCPYGCLNGACNPPPSVCGNSVIEGSEQCDDGNTVSEDGCNASCQTENPTVSLRFTFVDAVKNTPLPGVHDIYKNQPQSDANGLLTVDMNRSGASLGFEKGCYGYVYVRIEKNTEGKPLALIIEPFDSAKRIIDISGKNEVDVTVASGAIPLYPFAQFAFASTQPLSFGLSYDLKKMAGTISISQNAKTAYRFHPGIPRGYEAKNVQIVDANNTIVSCPSYTPSMIYDPSVCKAAVLTVSTDTCTWSEE